MTLDELHKIWSADATVDRTELGEEAIKIPQLHSKYFKLFSSERLTLRKLVEGSKSLQLNLWSYYQGKLDYETLQELGWQQNDHIILKADIPMHVDANQDWINSNLKIAYQKEKVDLLESILKSLNGRGFNISAAIQWEKFKVGI
jgi:hypothetical protein|tara:strand:- start:2181 stop:2615 length:435 start_codon:yes stop_codon:yes gene_type:complete